MSDVVPLERDPRGRVRATPRLTPAPRPAPPSTRARAHMADEGDDLPDFVAPGVDRREIRKLKRGDHVPAERRDLHGMKAAEATAAVRRFLTSSRHKHHRCVCIVHGRGLHSAGSTPVLKTAVRALLRSDRSVLAYADAPASDGGAGAVYVLLRR
jgi:DNA-nicking Smr family endonuclease